MGLLSLPLEIILCIADLFEKQVDIWSFARTTSHFHECLTRHMISRFPLLFLRRAILDGRNDLLERVLQTATSVNINMASDYLDCHTPLSFAIQAGRPAIVGTLLQQPNIDIHLGAIFWKRKPLQQATMYKNTGIMTLLLSHPDMDISHASEALWTAVETGKGETVETLLQHDVDPNQYRDDGSLLSYALQRFDQSAARLLMADKRTDLDTFYQELRFSALGYPKTEPVPIILKLMEKLPQDDLDLLWSNRARVTTLAILDECGNTALHLMARRGHIQWCQTLLAEYPQMLYMANTEGCLPLSIAMDWYRVDVCDLFCWHDAACYQTPNVQGEVPLVRVIRAGCVELLQKLQLHEPIKEQLFHSQGFDGTTPLMEATRRGQYDMVENLINLGVDPNIANEAGYTPLIFAVQQRSVKGVKVLLKFNNVDVNQHDSLGWNAMIWAKWPGQKRKKGSRKAFRIIEKLLIARGANLGLLLDNAERNKRPSSWHMWLTGPGRGSSRRRTLISDT